MPPRKRKTLPRVTPLRTRTTPTKVQGLPPVIGVRLMRDPPRPSTLTILEARLRAAQARARASDAALARVAVAGLYGSPGVSPASTSPVSSPANINLNALGTKAESFVQLQQQVRAFEAAVKRAESLSQTLGTLQRQESVFRQSLANTQARAAVLRSKNTQRILQERARGNQTNETLIRQEHNAAIGVLRQEAATIRDALRDIRTRQEGVRGDLQEASEAAAESEMSAREARAAAQAAAQALVQTPASSKGGRASPRRRSSARRSPPRRSPRGRRGSPSRTASRTSPSRTSPSRSVSRRGRR